MDFSQMCGWKTRREMLQAATAVAGGALLGGLAPRGVFAAPGGAARAAYMPQAGAQSAASAAAAVDAMRKALAMAPMTTMKLADNITLLSGPGGNVTVLDGPDGKVMVDDFVQTVQAKLQETLNGISNAPLKFVVNTHWHFDHTDNNAAMHKAGATLLGHENTRKRLTETHHLDILNLTFTPSPAEALPQQTFRDNFRLFFNNEQMTMGYFGPAHTDGDIWVRYEKANVLHVADIFFNGFYPFIDRGTRGGINGMINAANKALAMADDKTKIVPGHGPLGDKAALTKYISVMTACRDKVKELKTQGKSLKEAIAAKPTAEFDDPWGKVLIPPDGFVTLIYTTL
jgi:cyclase